MSVQTTITKKLQEEFQAHYLDVINESYQHNVPKNAESHFKVIIVSDAFLERSLVQRHRLIYQLLADELAGEIHALSLQCFTPAEWESGGKNKIIETPGCRGGSRK